jgi:hypothetical protein
MLVVKDTPANRPFIDKYEIRYFQPFQPKKMDEGLQKEPNRVVAEALRVLRAQPENHMARNFVSNYMHQNPDALLAQEQSGSASP